MKINFTRDGLSLVLHWWLFGEAKQEWLVHSQKGRRKQYAAWRIYLQHMTY